MKFTDSGPSSKARLPVLFIGHGSPINAIEQNNYTESLSRLQVSLPKPKSILVISAHWLTRGTWVTSMAKPKTIHDFYGFPRELFEVQYPAAGNPELAGLIAGLDLNPKIQADGTDWGLDHGTWSILRHLYPEANIPVVQLSLDISQPLDYHFNLGKKLYPLRDEGVLILGSGNLVHNLKEIRWGQDAKPFDWAVEFDEWSKDCLVQRDFDSLLYDFHKTQAGKLSVPSLDHYLPLHYVLGATHPDDALQFDFEGIQNGSISMRSFRFG